MIKQFKYQMDESLFWLQDKLKKEKKNFTVINTNMTTKVRIFEEVDNYKTIDAVETIYMYNKAEQKYNVRELGRMQKLRKEVYRNLKEKNLEPPNLHQSDIRLFDFGSLKKYYNGDNLELKNIIEYDIAKAYYKSAYHLGYISRDFYNECLGLPKHIRLRLIGSIATNRRVLSYTKGVIRSMRFENDPLMRRVWFHICKHVDDCMLDLKLLTKSDYLFMWVDGIFFRRNGNMKLIKEAISHVSMQYDLSFKEVRVRKIVIDPKDEIVTVFKGGKTKPYNIERD